MWPRTNEYWRTYSSAVSLQHCEEVQRRLPQHREAAFSDNELGTTLAIGELFAELCALEGGGLAAFGTNVFSRTREAACNLLNSLEVDFADGAP